MANGTPTKVLHSISMESVLKILLIVIAVAFAWNIRDIIALFFVSLLLSAALDPSIDYLRQYKIPRALGVLLIYVVFISLFLLLVIGISKPLAAEVSSFSKDLPSFYLDIDRNLQNFQQSTFLTPERVTSLRNGLDDLLLTLTRVASGNILPFFSALFGGLLSLMLVLVITFYLTVQESALRQFLIWLTPKNKEKETASIMEKIKQKLGWWLRGQMVLSLIIFLITYVGLKILGIQYALVLALLAGFFETIPYLGPVLSAVPAVFLTLISPWGGVVKAVFVVVLYILIQQAENHLLVPKVMAKSVGLNPLIVIFSILIGAKLAGIVGALVAVPAAAAITVYIQEKGLTKEF